MRSCQSRRDIAAGSLCWSLKEKSANKGIYSSAVTPTFDVALGAPMTVYPKISYLSNGSSHSLANHTTSAQVLTEPGQLALVLALGWSAAELIGRYRHGIHPRNPAARKRWEGRVVPRLSYSSRALQSNNALFWLSTQRLIVLSDQLGLDDLEGKDKPDSIDARIRALPGEIRKYINDPNSTTALEPEAFYQLLEDWTRLVRLELAVRSWAMREVFSFSGDLADLYWALPVPDWPNLNQWPEDWRKVLYKVGDALENLDKVKSFLPPYTFEALQENLHHWQRVNPVWLQNEFTLEQARDLCDRLGEQAGVWGAMLQREQRPEDYLRRADWLWVGILSVASFGAVLVAVLLGFAAVVVGLSWLTISVLVPVMRPLLPGQPDPSKLVETPSVSDWLAVGGLLAAVVTFSISVARWLFHRSGDVYRWLRGRFISFFVRRRTVVRWQGE